MMVIDLGSLNGTIDEKCNGVNAVASIYWLPLEERGLKIEKYHYMQNKVVHVMMGFIYLFSFQR